MKTVLTYIFEAWVCNPVFVIISWMGGNMFHILSQGAIVAKLLSDYGTFFAVSIGLVGWILKTLKAAGIIGRHKKTSTVPDQSTWNKIAHTALNEYTKQEHNQDKLHAAVKFFYPGRGYRTVYADLTPAFRQVLQQQLDEYGCTLDDLYTAMATSPGNDDNVFN